MSLIEGYKQSINPVKAGEFVKNIFRVERRDDIGNEFRLADSCSNTELVDLLFKTKLSFDDQMGFDRLDRFSKISSIQYMLRKFNPESIFENDLWKNIPVKSKKIKPITFEIDYNDKNWRTFINEFTAKQDTRFVFNGVYFDKSRIVTTDGHGMMVYEKESPSDYLNKIINHSEKCFGEIIEGNFPDYKMVLEPALQKLNTANHYIVELNRLEANELFDKISMVKKYYGLVNENFLVNLNKDSFGIKNSYMLSLLKSFLLLGDKILKLSVSVETCSPMLAQSENCKWLVMPFKNKEEGFVITKYIEEQKKDWF